MFWFQNIFTLSRKKKSKSNALLKEPTLGFHGNSVSISIDNAEEFSNIAFVLGADNSNETKILSDVDDRIKFSEYKNVEDAKLTIEKANLTDRGYFTCVGKNELMEDSARAEGFVRVKDKLAALWPFLGICAEVFVLCAIILIYEKRRNKTDLDESDTDQSPDQ